MKKNGGKKSGVKKSWEKKIKKVLKKSAGEKSKQAVVEVASELLFGLVLECQVKKVWKKVGVKKKVWVKTMSLKSAENSFKDCSWCV